MIRMCQTSCRPPSTGADHTRNTVTMSTSASNYLRSLVPELWSLWRGKGPQWLRRLMMKHIGMDDTIKWRFVVAIKGDGCIRYIFIPTRSLWAVSGYVEPRLYSAPTLYFKKLVIMLADLRRRCILREMWFQYGLAPGFPSTTSHGTNIRAVRCVQGLNVSHRWPKLAMCRESSNIDVNRTFGSGRASCRWLWSPTPPFSNWREE